MLSHRQILRAAPRRLAAQQLRAPTPAAQRRLASSNLASSAAAAGENAFVAERRHIKEHAASTTQLWRKIAIYGVPICLVLGGINAYTLWNEHWEHWSHMPPLEERVEYPYQNIRTKNYTWGDGDKTLFWNPSVNYHNHDKTK